MQKHNILKSGNFHMHTGDVLHLIFRDEQGTPVTIDLVSTPEPGEVIEVVPGQVTMKSATNITSSSFSANWNLTENTVGYYLDVATDSTFTSFVSGYENKALGYVNTASVTGLTGGLTYYYRVRAFNNIGTGINSDVSEPIPIYANIGSLVTSWTEEITWDTFSSTGSVINTAINDNSSPVYVQSNDMTVIPTQNVYLSIDTTIVSGSDPQFRVWDKDHNVAISNPTLSHGVNTVNFTIPTGCSTIYFQVLNVINFGAYVDVNFGLSFL